MKKAKGWALCLAHDLEKEWMSKFQTFFFMTYYICTIRFVKTRRIQQVPFSLRKSHGKVTCIAKYCILASH